MGERFVLNVNLKDIWLLNAGVSASIVADMVTSLKFVEQRLNRIKQKL